MKYTRAFPSEHRDAAVRRVLAEECAPMGPTQIAECIGEPWCTRGFTSAPFALGSAVIPVLHRIGAVRNRGGWMLPRG